MANEGLLITRRRSLAGLFLDATVEERYTSQSSVTVNPVEFGASISDHRIRLPDKYILSGRVSDLPLREDTSNQWAEGAAETRSKSAWAVLRDLKDEGDPFVIESGLQRYDDMVIQTLTAQQSSLNSTTLDFVAECIQVIIVNTEDAVVDNPEPGQTEEQASEEVDRGDVQTTEPEEQREQSWLLKLLDILGIDNGS